MSDRAFPSASPPIAFDSDLEAALPSPPRWIGLRRFVTTPAGAIGSALLLALIAIGALAPWLSPWLLGHVSELDQFAIHPDPTLSLHRALSQAPPAILPSLAIGALAGLASALLGLAIGGLAGYFGGWIDGLLSRLMEFASALPFLPFSVAVIAATGSVQGVRGIVIIFSLLGWVSVARLVRAELLVLREQPFTEAAQSVGVSHPRILLRHLFPHLYPITLIATLLAIANFMIAEATLDFLRIGVTGTPTLGSLLADYNTQTAILGGQDLPKVLIPGATLWLIVLALQLIGQGLQQTLDAVHER